MRGTSAEWFWGEKFTVSQAAEMLEGKMRIGNE
jgi:hypothetical protein